MRRTRHYAVTALCALATWAMPRPAAAQEGFQVLCGLLADQARVTLEDLEVAVRVSREESLLAEDLFDSADLLWQDNLLATAVHLDARHRRRAARIVVDLAQRRVDRQRVVVGQHELACSDSPTPGIARERATIGQVRQRYLEADCAVRELELALGEMVLEYQEEALSRAEKLVENDIVPRQQALSTSRAVDATRYRLELARERAARCRR